jgi:stage II sporulation protein D
MQLMSTLTAFLYLPKPNRIRLLSLLSKCRWFVPFLWLLLIAPAQAGLELRVAIEEKVGQVRVGSSTPAVVRDASGKAVGQLAAMDSFYAQDLGGAVSLNRWRSGKLWVEPSKEGYVFIGDRWYRGRTLLTSNSAGMTAVNYVDLEHYLYSVVGSEMGGNWPQEALKAQAVASRSYALHKRQSGNGLYDVGDTVTYQVYKGLSNETINTQKAVNATQGQILSHASKIIQAVFHSSSGGHTENVEDVWTSYLPYLRGVPDYDQGSPVFQWTKQFSREQVNQSFPGLGQIVAIQPARTSQTGRAMTVKLTGSQGNRVVDADAFRRALGLKSTWFAVTPTFEPVASASIGTVAATPRTFQLQGRGYGHGLGMSQWGAYNLAQKGYKHTQILSHYYKGTQLGEIDVR